MCVYMYLCMCVYMYLCMCIYVSMYVCVYVYICLCMCVYMYVYVCMCVYVYVNEWFYNILRAIFYSRIPRILRMSNLKNITHGSIYGYDIYEPPYQRRKHPRAYTTSLIYILVKQSRNLNISRLLRLPSLSSPFCGMYITFMVVNFYS